MEANNFLTDTDDFDQYIEGLLSGKKPSQTTIAKICDKAKEILSEEPNVVFLRAPMTICGNVGGELENMLEIFHLIGKPPETNFVFLGNYFHRGSLGVETFSLILALKVRYKNRVTILRGMGEDPQLSQCYGFYDECEAKYGNSHVWRLFVDVLNFLPLCAVVDNTYFCIAGGLIPSISVIDQVQILNRYEYSPDQENTIATLIWSDPGDREEWGPNHRGLGFCFPKKATKKFLHANNLKVLCRANGILFDGYAYTHDNMVLSICSAPDARGIGNLGALVEVDEYSGMKIKQFSFPRKRKKSPHRSGPFFKQKYGI